ncbi:orotidine 5'-phosphate decarboxylase [Rhodococcoides trifolii]|uniref:Orotidine-5'-phosphate decarboxylase n=1 Tax=Rhodococcoides trifolii TaxID=908250 RepID=A0A917D2M5_9NOCA|nr:orotidine-5'-phosphate decarboxylase [Rhodococcus trifolii]GGG09269.1 orotidine 5'-phosphate decarboxylase [Rhodococcus trifolii]
MTWVRRLRGAVAEHGRLCVGIDPHPGLLDAWGLGDTVDGLGSFSNACVEAFAGHVGIVKPQVAFFERFGSAGIAVLERTIAGLRSAGTLVLSDAKRGDIGTTLDAYASAWLGSTSPLRSDAVTLSPYLGVGALAPAIERAAAHQSGVFVLARTSNADGTAVQTAVDSGGVSVAQHVVDEAARWNAGLGDETVGLVVGATRGHGLDVTAFGGPILAPGLGAQGATVLDLAEIFPDTRELLLPSSSRDILRYGPATADLRAAAHRVRDDVERALS